MDLKAPFTVAFQAETFKEFELNYPDDAFWLKRVKLTKITRTSTGGRETTDVAKPRAHDLEGVTKFAISVPAEADEYDAHTVIKALAKIEAGAIERPEANVIRINAIVFGDQEVYVDLKSPSRKQVETSRKASSSSYSTSGGNVTLLDAAPVVKLFRELFIGSDGYENGVPVPHIDVYVQALFNEIDPNG